MKKLYTTSEYKAWQKRWLRKTERKSRTKNSIGTIKRSGVSLEKENTFSSSDKKKSARTTLKLSVIAPRDFRLFENTEMCLSFFRDIRSEEYLNVVKNFRFVKISLEEVEEIDYGTVSILTALSDDLKFKGIILHGDFPKKPECKAFIIDSGFLNHMVDEKNHKFPKADKSDLIFFEKGCGVLSNEDNRRISEMVIQVINHLTGEKKHFRPVKTILLEICGNSIEWAYTDNKQWLLGVKYETEKVIFTVTDVGKGILETLHRKFSSQLKDIFTVKSNLEILKGAFSQKYGSNTREVNRNKGLPAVRTNSELGTIKDLKVLTNNVVLHFENDTLSETFERGSARFRGTIFQWEMNKDCINKTKINYNEIN